VEFDNSHYHFYYIKRIDVLKEKMMSREEGSMRRRGWVVVRAPIQYVPRPGKRKTSQKYESARRWRRAMLALRNIERSGWRGRVRRGPEKAELQLVKRQWRPGKPFVVLSFGYCIGSVKSILGRV
jgi:hypothetical protein